MYKNKKKNKRKLKEEGTKGNRRKETRKVKKEGRTEGKEGRRLGVVGDSGYPDCTQISGSNPD